VCVDGQVLMRGPDSVLLACGRATFDPTVALCCDSVVRANIDGTRRCCDVGMATYNPSMQVCCSGTVWNDGPEVDYR